MAKHDPRCGTYENRGPDSYVAWSEWAEKKSRTHVQIQCPGCQRWTVWVSKRSREGQAAMAARRPVPTAAETAAEPTGGTT